MIEAAVAFDAEVLERQGFALIPEALAAADCRALVEAYSHDRLYRSTVVMQRHGFGRGEYRYFADPLPSVVARLRSEFYERLAPAANRWNALLGVDERFPRELGEYRERCAAAGQRRPTCLILKYGPGDENALHQDLYGERAFPFQLTVYLSAREDYEGGESVIVRRRPRMQSIATVITAKQGDALVFPNRFRPARGSRGYYREDVRHGVSVVRSGARFALGIVFHDGR